MNLPIGTTWCGSNKQHIAFIWIDFIGDKIIWYWSVYDGITTLTNYTFSYYTAKRDMPFVGRMKRVKQINDLIE